MNEEQIIKRHKKIDQHYKILVNDINVKILNYKIEKGHDEFFYIELITKVSNEIFENKFVNIKIEKDNKKIEVIGTWAMKFSQPGLKRYKYKIKELNEFCK